MTSFPMAPSFYLPLLRYMAILILGLSGGAGKFMAAQTGSQGSPSPSAEKLLQEGLQAYRAHQMSRALSKLQQAYKLSPGNPNVRLILGLMLYEKDPASLDAQHLMESVALQFHDNLELQLKLLDSYLRLKTDAKWPPMLDRLQGTMKENTRFAFEVIYTLVRYGRIEPSRTQLDKISNRLQPKMQGLTVEELKAPDHKTLQQEVGEIYFIRGLIAASADKKSEALGLFQTADRYEFPSPNSPQMQMLAEALYRMEEYRLSSQAYEIYLKHFPADATAWMHLALSYYFRGSFESAKENFQKVLEQAPQTPTVHLYLGLTFLELKSNEQARQQFLEELKSDPQSYQAMAELAYVAYSDGDNELCRQWLEKARPLNPQWVETNMVYGLLYNRLGQFDQAIQCLEKAVKEKPNYYKAHFQLSLAYRRSGDETKAKEHADIYDRLVAEEKARNLGDSAPRN